MIPPALRLVPGGGSVPFVDEVFEALVEVPKEERALHLARLCAGFPDIEAEVRALLSVADGDVAPTPPREVSSGDRLGPYRLEERLGAGSSGSVWRAFDEHLQAWTALKVFRPRQDDDALEAVLREARAASGILSDHVVRIKSAGRFPDGPHFLEMLLCAEYRPGPAGEQLVVARSLAESPPLSAVEAARMVADAARGVEDAHRIGVIHRDVKPANILVLPVSRRALVTDFGLAAPGLHAPPSAVGSPTATVTVEVEGGRIVGTPAFMAPEQAAGAAPGRTTDVYSLGATLYALLANRPPYLPTGRHPVPALDVIAGVRAGPPPPLPTGVPRRLRAIVDKAMARNPVARYPTALALAVDLDAWRSSRPTSIERRTPWLALVLFCQRNRELVATAAGMAILLLLSISGLAVLEIRRIELDIAVGQANQRRVSAEGEAERADRVRSSAERERDEAISEADAATKARALAEINQTAAERQAAEALHALQRAQEAERAAVVARDAAEQNAAMEAALREVLALDLVDAQAARAQAELDLEAAVDARAEAQMNADRAEAALQEKRAEVDSLRSQLGEADGLSPLPGVE
jgi:serine/threonine protein kinase